MQTQQIEQVVQKLQAMTPNQVSEVRDFVDFLYQRDSEEQLIQSAMSVSEQTLNTVWNNVEDAEYDAL